MRQFKDKICVITGAASGIGAACARAMAADGALVIGTDLRQDMLAETKAAVEKQGGRMETFMVDVADRDAMFEEAARLIVIHQQGSASLLQRKLKLGYNRAGRIIDQLEAAGIIGPFEGSKARQVLVPDELSLEQILKPDA